MRHRLEPDHFDRRNTRGMVRGIRKKLWAFACTFILLVSPPLPAFADETLAYIGGVGGGSGWHGHEHTQG